MAIKYIAGSEDTAKLINRPFDQEDSWWGGVQGCFASVAAVAALAVGLSTAVATATVARHQDDPAGKLVNLKVDEQYWWTSPTVSAPWNSKLQGDDTDASFPVVTFAPDEGIWTPPTLWQVPAPQPVVTDLVETLPYLIDEDYWYAGGTTQAPWLYSVFTDTDTYTFQPDEDYWQASFVPQSAWLAKAFTDDDVVFPVAPSFFPDEDYWVGLVLPSSPPQSSLYLPDTQDDPAGFLYNPVEEYYWVAPQAVSSTWGIPQFFVDLDFVPTPSSFIPDEDYWNVAQVVQSPWTTYLPPTDVDFITLASSFVPDEDYWFAPSGTYWTSPVAFGAFTSDDVIFAQPGPKSNKHANPTRLWHLVRLNRSNRL